MPFSLKYFGTVIMQKFINICKCEMWICAYGHRCVCLFVYECIRSTLRILNLYIWYRMYAVKFAYTRYTWINRRDYIAMGRLSKLKNLKCCDHGAHCISRDHEVTREMMWMYMINEMYFGYSQTLNIHQHCCWRLFYAWSTGTEGIGKNE